MVCSVFNVKQGFAQACSLLLTFCLAGDQNMVSGVGMMMEESNLHIDHSSWCSQILGISVPMNGVNISESMIVHKL